MRWQTSQSRVEKQQIHHSRNRGVFTWLSKKNKTKAIAEPIIFTQPRTDRIQGVIYSFSQANEEQK